MPDDISIGERIAELAAAQRINLKELSRRADVPYTTLYAIVSRKSNRVQKTTLHKIANALGASVELIAGTGDTYLNDSDSRIFKTRVSRYFKTLNADLNNLQDIGLYTYLHLEDDNYKPTKDDVVHFSEDTGLSISYLVGIEDDDSQQLNKEKIQIAGFNDIEVALCERHIKHFIADDLKQVVCSAEDAEAVALMVLKHIGAGELVSLAKTVNLVSPDYRKAALAVLETGIESALIEKGERKGLNVTRSHYYADKPEFDIWGKAAESENVKSEFTIATDVDFIEALSIIDSYTGKEKTPQDQNDPET